MRNLPTLPGCGQPATIRIEVYSPTPSGGLHGSLDGVAYGCDVHQRAIVTMLNDAGLAPYRTVYRPAAGEAVSAVCGTLRRFDAPVEPAGPTDHNGTPATTGVTRVVEPTLTPCAECGQPIEHVDTPAGLDPEWHPPYWRHIGDQVGQLHAARPAANR